MTLSEIESNESASHGNSIDDLYVLRLFSMQYQQLTVHRLRATDVKLQVTPFAKVMGNFKANSIDS